MCVCFVSDVRVCIYCMCVCACAHVYILKYVAQIPTCTVHTYINNMHITQ